MILGALMCPHLEPGVKRYQPKRCPVLAVLEDVPFPFSGYVTRCGHGHVLPHATLPPYHPVK